MPDPKAALTKFDAIFAARREGEAGGNLDFGVGGGAGGGPEAMALWEGEPANAAGAPELTRVFAAGGAVKDAQSATLATVQQDYSISTVQEVVALAHVDRNHKTDLVRSLGLPARAVAQMEKELRAAPSGKEELRDWTRYDRFRYHTGCEINLNKPPATPRSRAGAAFGLGGDAHVMGAALAAMPPEPTGHSLINAHMSAIRDQGQRGTCTAFAAVACLEYQQRLSGTHPRADLSEQFAYWSMVKRTGKQALVQMFSSLKIAGTCSERTWPYDPVEIVGNDPQDPPPPHAIDRALLSRPANPVHLKPRSVPAIREAIAQDHVVAIGIPVYASWYRSPVVRKYGNITVPLPGEVPDNIGHAIALVGFQDSDEYAGGGYFIVRNSWDSNWATASELGAGYGTIPYRYISNFNWDAWYLAA